jgi:hypothetical protein
MHIALMCRCKEMSLLHQKNLFTRDIIFLVYICAIRARQKTQLIGSRDGNSLERIAQITKYVKHCANAQRRSWNVRNFFWGVFDLTLSNNSLFINTQTNYFLKFKICFQFVAREIPPTTRARKFVKSEHLKQVKEPLNRG